MSVGVPVLVGQDKTKVSDTLNIASFFLDTRETLVFAVQATTAGSPVDDPAWNGLTMTGRIQLFGVNGALYVWTLFNSGNGAGAGISFQFDSVMGMKGFAYKITGLNESAFDKVASASGTSTSPNSGNTATTTKADEILLAFIGTNGPVEDTAGSLGGSFTALDRDGTTGSTANTNATLACAYRIVSATGAYAGSKTGITSREWEAGIITLSAAAIPALAIILASPVAHDAIAVGGPIGVSMPIVAKAPVVHDAVGVGGTVTALLEVISMPPPLVRDLFGPGTEATVGENDAQAILSARVPTEITTISAMIRGTSPSAIGDGNASTFSTGSVGPPGGAGGTAQVLATAMEDMTPNQGAIAYVVFRAIAWFTEPSAFPPDGCSNARMVWTVGANSASASLTNDSGDSLYASFPITGDDDGIDPDEGGALPNHYVRTGNITTQPNGQPWTLAAINALVNVGLKVDVAATFFIDMQVAEIFAEIYGPSGTRSNNINLRQSIGSPIRHVSRVPSTL